MLLPTRMCCQKNWLKLTEPPTAKYAVSETPAELNTIRLAPARLSRKEPE